MVIRECAVRSTRAVSASLLLLLLFGCGQSSQDAGDDGASGATTSGGGNAAAGTVGAGAGTTEGGSAGENGSGQGGQAIGGAGGAPNAGTGGGGSGGGGGFPPNVKPTLNVAAVDVDVQGAGTVFNVSDNYFRDYFIPRTPVANFGLHSQIIAHPNQDGSIDVAWLDYAAGEDSPWSVPSPAMIYLTHIAPDLAGATTQASGVSSYKLLGFAQDGAGGVYLAYNKDHALKTDTEDDQNNINGNELHVTKLGDAGWDQLLFGDQDNNADETKGDPAGAASSVLDYDAKNDLLVLYQGHSMMWTPTRHQAGYLRLLAPDTGQVQQPAGQDVIHFGAGWFYSHNFNQRLIIDDGLYYVLAHGDAFQRRLGFARWSPEGYSQSNATDFDESYWDIAGNEGDNNTDAQTGQFAKGPDGKFFIVHTSSQGRNARDVRLVAMDGQSGGLQDEVWLTENAAGTHATIAKVQMLSGLVLVTYAVWPEETHDLTWYWTLLDTDLGTLTEPTAMPGVEFVDSAPLFVFSGGPNAGAVGWVSGNAAHTLSVGVAKIEL